jgi:hypothetical protein
MSQELRLGEEPRLFACAEETGVGLGRRAAKRYMLEAKDGGM